MTDITAIILAAGRGTRMGSRGKLTPKGLFQLGGRSLVEESVRSLRRRGIGSIVIVTGHLADQYENEVAGWDMPVELLYNPLYAERGSLCSLLVGLQGRAGGCLILESDFIYEPRALDAAMDDRSWLLLSGPTGAGDEVYVWTDVDATGSRRLRDMSKKRDHRAEPHTGELVGVVYLPPDHCARMLRIGAAMMETQPKSDYESGLVALAREAAIDCPRIDDLAWAEIDDETMFRRAEVLYPRIVAARLARGLAAGGIRTGSTG